MAEAVELTGMEYGGITPVGLPPDWPIFVAGQVAAAGPVVIGSGLRRSKLRLDGALLADLPDAQVVPDLALGAAASAACVQGGLSPDCGPASAASCSSPLEAAAVALVYPVDPVQTAEPAAGLGDDRRQRRHVPQREFRFGGQIDRALGHQHVGPEVAVGRGVRQT